ncbi:transient receptor potential channel pyrexia-like isoform X3 [Danaus plexippus]|uniref:transient receptor potential channel pyrexia-like isoform X3 n=1 Tax=Danaus plexippus TaxID=13037 RepID=UPI002AB079C8|nr:transient receptor potential channel pyrexia-like isoform X3 [Danaus plexippus]
MPHKDVEKGYHSEEEKSTPLLANNDRTRPASYEGRQRPPRPRKPTSNNMAPPPPTPPVAKKLTLDISSVLSTPDCTPGLDTSEYPKKFFRSDRRLRRLNTELLEAIGNHDVEEVEKLLKEGANPNATCRLDYVSAIHLAAMVAGDSLDLLLKHGAERHRQDRLGRTPLHLAAFAGNARQMAILLDLPEEMQKLIDNDDSSTFDGIRNQFELSFDMRQKAQEIVNVRSDLGEIEVSLPKTWKDNIDHMCMDIKGTLPLLQPGWTPLHVAASRARHHCTRFLLAAGANPNICDVMGRTPLDVAGSAYYYNKEINQKSFTEVIRMLLKAGSQFNTMRAGGMNVDSPIHTAVELNNIECILELLDAGVSVSCLNSEGKTPLHVCVDKKMDDALKILANYNYKDADPLSSMVDVKDKDGYTVLHAAVKTAWVAGVCIALEAGADVTITANDGETAIHLAAALGNTDVLDEIILLTYQNGLIDCQNEEGETPLFKAIINGHLNCVETILEKGASINMLMPGDVNVLHVAAEYGHLSMLEFLMEYGDGVIKQFINSLTTPDRRGIGAIHFAVLNNNVKCLEYLISQDADIRLRTTPSPHKSATPLHLAANRNYVECAKVILNCDKTTILEVNSLGWYPLHSAGHHGSRDVISLLLQEGADLSEYTAAPKFKRTAIDMIINNVSKPTEFLEDVFDSYISSNSQNLNDSKCVVTVDYKILLPTACEMEQMKVVESLLKTGNRYGQQKLLVHPLLESFLYLKWQALLPFFYAIIAIYAMFVSSLTIFITSIFFYKDTNTDRPAYLAPHIWSYVVYSTICLIILQELLYMNLKNTRYFRQLETWIKVFSLLLAASLPPVVAFFSDSVTDLPRHIATCSLLLSWIELMFLLSRFPNWGYYVLMFGKVASNVIKILLTFAFLVIGFSLSFMIQFKSEMPFDGPWAAFVKTMVMMTSEFDYMDLFDEAHSNDLAKSLIVVRLIFVIFLILAAIVLMNLMVGVAVNDINDLEILGNIRRLAKQVEFLGTLDNLVYNKFFSTILPNRVSKRLQNKRKVMNVMSFCPGKTRWRFNRSVPSRIKNAIIDKAQQQKKQMEEEFHMETFKKKIDEMHEAIVNLNLSYKDTQEATNNEGTKEIIQGIKKVTLKDMEILPMNECPVKVKKQVETQMGEANKSIVELNVKMDQMSSEMESIKVLLHRLESKLGNMRMISTNP